MLTYDMDNRGTETLQNHLYRCIREDIRSRRLSPDERLPSKRGLARHLHISVITVENAYAQLTSEGWLYALPRKGFFVSRVEHPPEDLRYAPPGVAPQPVAEYRLDLGRGRVDPSRFPFATWSRLMRQVLSEQDKKLLLPIPSQGVEALRDAIAAYLHSFRGMEVSPEQIIVGAGTEYLYQMITLLLGRGLRFAVEDPGYSKPERIYRSNGVDCVSVPLDEWGMSVSALGRSGAQVAHVSPSHHYPTGISMPIGRRQELLRWAGTERYILEDDYDSEFRFTGHPVQTLQSIDRQGRVIYLNTFSQTIAPSMRISYMVLPPRLVERYRRELGFYACTVPSFEQFALAKFIAGGYFEKHLNRMRLFYRTRREQVLSAFRSSSFAHRITLTERGAGLHFLLKLQTERSDEELRSRALALGIHLSFLSEYTRRGGFEHTLVINYGGVERPEEAVLALAEVFAE
ncbi:PLP-dependent aminotransferase family protein [Oscillibacter hominis]|uniref:PLP-dependent aminotransferase family protein n=1 Tax=Oscillibacter hominis TaxID=2763056 RepID=A0A7G9B477_9FIRM|nr:PLP-dependent aminotransferase family protein [Oscillibacter hominis]QNL44358.1 PLP-dependent aminotransferase family protein [Oscillibacter hominis]